ncbi:MAG TPA: polysaccharide deacetylase family protein [Roseiarcus sp.]|nr:polysaccharide deacetylase family protein [Roseiarcus sp.]
MDFKRAAIGLGFDAFRASGLHRLAGPALRGEGVLLTLHHVRPWRFGIDSFRPNRLLEIAPAFLDELLASVRRLGFDLVTIDEALRRLGEGGRPFAALTFDDGYRDLAEHALKVLERHEAPFAAYVTTGFADRTARLWWRELEESIRRLERVTIARPGLSIDLKTASLGQKAAAFNQIYWALRAGAEQRLLDVVSDLAAEARLDPAGLVIEHCMDWSEVVALSRHPLATIGAHAVTHRMLAKWPLAIAREEMAQSRREIEARIGKPIRHFAFPVGDPTSAGRREFELARELGFASAVTTRPGMLFSEHALHATALPRLSINGCWQDIRAIEVLLSGAPFALWNRGRRLNVA